jgi:hypothetical protein
MKYQYLLEKYNILLDEVNRLKIENSQLKAALGLREPQSFLMTPTDIQSETILPGDELNVESGYADVNKASDSYSKIHLFMSLFKGREDVYAKRWENPKKNSAGYAPVCLNQWRSGICGKPKIPCSKCNNTSYAELNESAIENHLRGHSVVGIYPMLPDDTCHFLAMDFDKADWQKDVAGGAQKKRPKKEKKPHWSNRRGQGYVKRHYRYCCDAIALQAGRSQGYRSKLRADRR